MARVPGLSSDPDNPLLRFDGDVLRLTYPYLVGRKRNESTRFELVTPIDSVVRVHEVREPLSTGGFALVVGLIVAASGSALIASGVARSGLSTSERGVDIGLGAFCVAGGLFGVGLDLYGMLTPRVERTLYPTRP